MSVRKASAFGLTPGVTPFAAMYALLICAAVKQRNPDGVPAGHDGSLAPLAVRYLMMPCPTCGSGTTCKPPVEVASRRPSYAKKKNARLFLIGPPTLPPKKFLSSGGRGSFASPAVAVPLITCGSVGRKRPALLLKKSFEVVTVLR